jgi:hypothetical protein
MDLVYAMLGFSFIVMLILIIGIIGLLFSAATPFIKAIMLIAVFVFFMIFAYRDRNKGRNKGGNNE